MEIIKIILGIIAGSFIGAGVANLILYSINEPQFVKQEWKSFAGVILIGVFAIVILLSLS